MRLKHICFLNPLTCRKSMEIVCVYCITTDHIFKPDKFDEASLNSTNSELRRTTARVSEQNIVQVWLVRSCEICAILCPWTSLDCSVCLWCLQMASFLIHFIAFGVPMFWIAWQFIYLSRTNLLTILILFWCFTDALPLAGQACGTGKGGRNWDPWSFWLPQGVYPKTAGRAGSKQTREWQSPEFFFGQSPRASHCDISIHFAFQTFTTFFAQLGQEHDAGLARFELRLQSVVPFLHEALFVIPRPDSYKELPIQALKESEGESMGCCSGPWYKVYVPTLYHSRLPMNYWDSAHMFWLAIDWGSQIFPWMGRI